MSVNVTEIEILEWAALTGCEVAVKSGNKLYVWPDFKLPAKVKVIEVPTLEEMFAEDLKVRLDSLLKPEPNTGSKWEQRLREMQEAQKKKA